MTRQEHARSTRVDAWLASGGAVLAANERAARSIASAHHAARQAEGRTAWQTPAIFSWESWARDQWLQQNKTGLMLLNPLQEHSLWTQLISRRGAGEGLLHPRRLAASAQQAYGLLCAYSPDSLRASTRAGWSGDPAIFSGWIASFESRCRRDELISRSRLPLELTEAFESGAALDSSDKSERPPLLLIGFDRLVKTQVSLLHAWGPWEQEEPGISAPSPQFLAAPDAATEAEACVRWLHACLAENPKARLIVVTTALEARRGELERTLLSSAPSNDALPLDFEFSLGIPLGRVSLARSAILLLRWLHEPLSESELDWLVSSGNCVASHEEEISLAGFMRELRRQGHEQPEWPIDDFISTTRSANQRSRTETHHAAWTARLLAARIHLHGNPIRQSPLQWISVGGELLDAIGWPGFRPLSSAAFQARERWEKVLEDCASLGFDGSQMDWPEFVSTLAEAVSTTIFAPESSDARIQVTEPLESAGQLADGIWFLGAQEDSWPGRGQAHPLLPAGLQRETGMPHASSQADWDLTQAATHRLLSSADNVVFSYARLSAEAETRPSRMIARLIGKPTDLPNEGVGDEAGSRTETFPDTSLLPFPHTEIGGGAATLTRQSLCPFQAFAITRLNAEDWSPAESGLNPKQRGQLLHSVLHRVWAGSTQGGISSLEELQEIPELRRFVATVVVSVMTESFDPARRNSIPMRFPQRYLELEARRLTRLVSEWLDYERQRMPFVVAETEAKRDVIVAGLKLTLRLDRIDRLANGLELIVDYKSSEIGPSAWAGQRPDDVQLPLYATYAVPGAPGTLEGLVFARVRPGEMKFSGRVRDASSLQPGINAQSALVRNPLTSQQLEEWHDRIEQLAEDFLAGRADVDPKDPRKTCEQCHLHTVCRIYENQSLAAALDESDEEQREEDQESAGIDA